MANSTTQLALTGNSVFNKFYNGYDSKKYNPNFIIINGDNYAGSGAGKGGNPLIKEITQGNDFLLDELKAFHTEMLAAFNVLGDLLKEANNKKDKSEKNKEKKEKKKGKSTETVSLFGGKNENRSKVQTLIMGALSKHIPFLREGYFEGLLPSEIKNTYGFMKQLNAARNEDAGKKYDRDSGKWVSKDAAPSDKKERKGMTKALTGLTSALLLKKKGDGEKKDGTLITMMKMFFGGKIIAGFMSGIAGASKIFGLLALAGKAVLMLLSGIGIAIAGLAAGLVGFVFGDWLNKEFGISEKLAPFFDTIFDAGEEIKKYVESFKEKLTNLLEWLDKDARRKNMKANPEAYRAEDRQEMADADIEKEFSMWKANNWDVNDPVKSAKKGAEAKNAIRARIEKEYGITGAEKAYEEARKKHEKENLNWFEYWITKPLGDGVSTLFNKTDYRNTQEQLWKNDPGNKGKISDANFNKMVKDNNGYVPLDYLPEEMRADIEATNANFEKQKQIELAEAQKAKNEMTQKTLKEAAAEEKVTAAQAKDAQPISINNQPITNVTNNNGGGNLGGFMMTRNSEDSYTNAIQGNKTLVFAG